MIPIRVQDGAILFQVAARPNAPRSRLQGTRGDAVKIAIAAQPERGKANKELCVFIAKALGIPKSYVTVTAGHTSRDKTVRVEQVTEADLRAWLD